MNNVTLTENELSITAKIEALLFVASSPVAPSQLAAVLNITTRKVEKELENLSESLRRGEQERGVRLQRHAGKYQLTTSPKASPEIEAFLGLETSTRLTQASLEVLSIVLYLQPVTRPKIDSIRGVNSDGVIRSLLRKGLIEEIGRAVSPGRPILYSSSNELLQHFGIESLDELPEIDSEEEDPVQIDEISDLQAELNR